MQYLPRDIKLQVCEWFTLRDLSKMRLVSRMFKSIADDPLLWRARVKRLYKMVFDSMEKRENVDWKKEFVSQNWLKWSLSGFGPQNDVVNDDNILPMFEITGNQTIATRTKKHVTWPTLSQDYLITTQYLFLNSFPSYAMYIRVTIPPKYQHAVWGFGLRSSATECVINHPFPIHGWFVEHPRIVEIGKGDPKIFNFNTLCGNTFKIAWVSATKKFSLTSVDESGYSSTFETFIPDDALSLANRFCFFANDEAISCQLISCME